MDKAPFLSVVIPAYNAERTIRRCLGSVEHALAGIDYEVVVVDDYSRDNTARTVEKAAERRSGLRLVRHGSNQGPGPARNTGLAEALGEYVWFVDADDEIPAKEFRGFEPVAACGGCDIFMFRYNRIEYKSNRLRPWEKFTDDLFATRPGDRFSARDFPDIVISMHALWNKWFRREAALALKMPMPPGLKEDFPFVAVALWAAEEIRFLDRVLYTYREDASTISRVRDERWLVVFEVCEAAEKRLNAAGADIRYMTSFHISRAHLMLVLYQHSSPEVRELMREGMEKYFRSLDGELFLRMTRHPFLLNEVKARLCRLRGVDPEIAGKAAKVVSAASGWLGRVLFKKPS